MTNETAQNFISLVRQTVCTPNSNPSRSDTAALTFSLLPFTLQSSILSLSRKHDMAHLLGERNAEYYQAIFRCTQQEEELKAIRLLFSEAGIAFIPLKGAVLSRYYPESWMRTRSDIDVLLHPEDAEKTVELLLSKGYQPFGKDFNRSHFVSPLTKVHLEIQYDLWDEADAHSSPPLSSVWNSSTCTKNTCEHALSPEVFYYYTLAHMAKHMRNGGCGVRNFLDIWVMRHRTDFNLSECDRFAASHDLAQFNEVCIALSEKWFSSESVGAADTAALTFSLLPFSQTVSSLESFILSGGIYGSREHAVDFRIAKQGRGAHLLQRIFMPYRLMCVRYPFLSKHKILLPVMWLVRCFQSAFGKNSRRIRKEARQILSTEKSEQKTTADFFQSIGL